MAGETLGIVFGICGGLFLLILILWFLTARQWWVDLEEAQKAKPAPPPAPAPAPPPPPAPAPAPVEPEPVQRESLDRLNTAQEFTGRDTVESNPGWFQQEQL